MVRRRIRDPNARERWDERFELQLRQGWFRKPRYRLLAYVFPRWALEKKIRKTYHLPVAGIAEGRFLDLGCGLGSCAAYYAWKTGRPAVGLDFAMPAVAYALAECRRHGIGASFVSGDASALPFRDASFDSAYIGQVLEHLERPDGVIREAARVLRPGGKLIISVPRGDACSGDGEAGHVNFYWKEEDCLRLIEGLPLERPEFHPFHRHRFFLSARTTGGAQM